MSRSRGTLRIGTSGYHYEHWSGPFYPEDLPKAEWFSHYAKHFDTVEINNTFYHLPPASVFDGWRKQAPPGFCYALKFSRYGSHITRLKKPRATLGKFLTRAKRLGEFLGPILVQLPPRWKVNPARLAAFLQAAPKDFRWSVEFRDPSWLREDVYGILNEHGAALCMHDMIGDHPKRLTANWTYLRFHGDHYGGSYSHQFLTARAAEVQGHLADGLDVYVYFNNDAQGYAVQNAKALKQYVTT
jgi:uncharacterized protein YecE (DUF72 family)